MKFDQDFNSFLKFQILSSEHPGLFHPYMLSEKFVKDFVLGICKKVETKCIKMLLKTTLLEN